MKKVFFARGLSVLAIGLFFASSSIGNVIAAVPTEKQMRDAFATFPALKDSSISKFERKDGAQQATVNIAGGKRGTLVGYIPKGKNKVFLALVIDRVTIGQLLGEAVRFGFDDVKLRDVTLLLVPPGDVRGAIQTKDLPLALSKNLKPVVSEFKAKIGLMLFARLDAKPAGVVGDALKLIGLTKYDDITIQATVEPKPKKKAKKNVALSVTLKKKSKWNSPFQLRKVNGRTTYLEGLTLMISGKPTDFNVAGWGQINLNRKSYFLFAQYTKTPKKLGKAYGVDAKSITLQSIADFAAALPWAAGFPTAGLNKLPLEQIRLSNPNYKPYDPKSDNPPAFRNMVLVAASPSVRLPDRRAVNGTAGLIANTPGPFLYANAAATVFGQRIASLEAIMDINGLKADAKLGLKSVGPIKFAGGLDFKLAPKGSKSRLNHEITLTGRTSLHGLPELSLSMAVDRDRMSYTIPDSCPINPLSIKGSVPTGAGLVLNGIENFDVDFKINDCYSEAIMAAVKEVGKLADFSKNLAEDQIAIGATAAAAIGKNIVNADKSLKSAWKTSVNASQTAANAVKSLDDKIGVLGDGIRQTTKAISDLTGEIKDIGKKIVKAITGITKLKKNRKKKKKTRSAKRAKKSKLEQERTRARGDRGRAKKALGKVSPYFAPKVVEARTKLSGLRYERKLAAARERYAKRLKKDFENSSKRKKLIALVDAGAITAALLKDTKIASANTNTSVSAIKERLLKQQTLIEEQIVTAAFDKAMENHLAKIKPDPEPEIPYDTDVRIVGEYNLCLEAYRRTGKIYGVRKDGEKVVLPAEFLPGKIRINTCHSEPQTQVGPQRFATQRFRFTSAGKLVALFGRKTVCFNSSGAKLKTTICRDRAEQIFFVDPTIDAIRPMLAKKGKEPNCIQRRYAARPGAQLQISNCAYTKSGNNVKGHQQWHIAKWGEAVPQRQETPLLSSLWTHYKKGYRKASTGINDGVVSLNGLIRLRTADQGGGRRDYNEPIDTLPPELRPDKRLVFNVNSHEVPSRIDILPNGRVMWTAGNKAHGWVSLDNISYPVKGVKPLKLNSGCKRYSSSSFRVPSYHRSGNTVMLSGLINCKFNAKRHIATLPAGHRPAKILVFSTNAHTQSARINVLPNGKVWWIAGGGGTHNWVSLDGVVFNLPGTKTKALPLTGNCVRYKQKKFAAPTATTKNGMVRLSGLVDCPFRIGQRHNFAVLPKNMRPAERLVFNANAHERTVRVDVRPDGKVRLEVGWRREWRAPANQNDLARGILGRGWLSLDGISFPVAAGKNMALKW